MAHFAQLDNNNKVIQVIVIADKDTADSNGIEKEEIGIAFCKSLFGENTNWIQTSYNASIRGIYASIDDVYDAENDVFVRPDLSTILENIIDAEVVEPMLAIEGN